MLNEQSQIIVELPTDWLLNPIDGIRHRIFLTNVMGALSKLHPSIVVKDVPWGTDFVERTPPKSGALFSFHSVGEVHGVWRLKEAAIPPLYAVDRTGHSGWSEIANDKKLQEKAYSYDLEKAKIVLKSYKERFQSDKLSKYPQASLFDQEINDYVFIPLQVQSDPVAKFADIDALTILKTASMLSLKTGIHVVVKRHPYCDSDAIAEFIESATTTNPFFHTSHSNIHDLIEHCSSVITVNSGVGLEALIHGKPVYACGLSEWSPASHRIKDAEELQLAFNKNQPEVDIRSTAYLGYLLSEYWIDGSDFLAVSKKMKRCLNESKINKTKKVSIDPTKLEVCGKIGELERQLAMLTTDLKYFKDENEKFKKTS
ncbi:hypothetical protein ACFQ3K_03330 [Brucella gallinifaecis]|uniref:Capsule polysaccharide biosynthesis protein n=1 Tax=Brucella gallinifaecis TaxID=215590 RepID=A0A502BN01_9HYPH|nr:hypothetical protein [Brucella gallinifaecis]TPF75207.1 hypothetical protein FHY56_10850 [Brucella gallinifaecis]